MIFAARTPWWIKDLLVPIIVAVVTELGIRAVDRYYPKKDKPSRKAKAKKDKSG